MPALKRWIDSYEGEFQADTDGNVYSWKSGEPKILKPTARKGGHLLVYLNSSDGKRYKRAYVHRVIYETFKLRKLKRSDWIIHKDGDLSNNKITNLELKNTDKSSAAKEIKYEVIEEGGETRRYTNRTDISREYGISPSKIKKGLRTGEWIEVIQKKNL